MRARHSPFVLLLFGAVLACAALTPFEEETCGNGVIDPATEDCDGFALNPRGACRPPGVAGACRADCTQTGDHNSSTLCPPGWLCGSDSLCRAPNGRFELDKLVAATARRILIADVDLDSKNDIIAVGEPDSLGFASMRIDFVDDRLTVVKETVLDVPAKGVDVTGNLTFLTAGQAIASLRGRRDRAFDLVSMRSMTSSIWGLVHRSDTNELAALTYINGDAVLAVFDGITFGRKVIDFGPGTGLIFTVQKLAPSDPCETMAYARPGDVSVQLNRLCTSDGAWGKSAYSSISLIHAGASPAVAGHRLVFADIDKNKRADLLIEDSKGLTHVVYNDGDGTFSSVAGSSTADTLLIHVGTGAGDDASISPRGILAAGDINADGEPDYATKKGLYVSDTSLTGGTRYALAASDDSWGEAAFADFNGDARLDLIAASASAPQLTFVQSGSDGLQTASIATSAIADELAVGDLDGDLFVDLAFRQTIRGKSDLDVLFGRPGLPGPISTALSNDGIRAIVAERAVAGSSASPAIIPTPARLAVANSASFSDDQMAQSVTFLQVSRSRQWSSPVVLGGERSAAIAMAYEHGATLALGITARAGRWHPQLFDMSSPATPVLDIPSIEAAVSTKDDLPRAALALVASDEAARDALALYSPSSTASAMLIAMHDSGGTTESWGLVSVTPFDAVVDETTTLASEDLDGDEVPELVVLSSPGGGEPHSLQIFWSGDGTSSGSHVEAAYEDVQSFTFVAVAASGPRALAYCANHPAGARPAVIAAIGADRAISTRYLNVNSPGAHLPTSIASGDIDGDGLPDLAYADSTGIHVLRSVPASQLSASP